MKEHHSKELVLSREDALRHIEIKFKRLGYAKLSGHLQKLPSLPKPAVPAPQVHEVPVYFYRPQSWSRSLLVSWLYLPSSSYS